MLRRACLCSGCRNGAGVCGFASMADAGSLFADSDSAAPAPSADESVCGGASSVGKSDPVDPEPVSFECEQCEEVVPCKFRATWSGSLCKELSGPFDEHRGHVACCGSVVRVAARAPSLLPGLAGPCPEHFEPSRFEVHIAVRTLRAPHCGNAVRRATLCIARCGAVKARSASGWLTTPTGTHSATTR